MLKSRKAPAEVLARFWGHISFEVMAVGTSQWYLSDRVCMKNFGCSYTPMNTWPMLSHLQAHLPRCLLRRRFTGRQDNTWKLLNHERARTYISVHSLSFHVGLEYLHFKYFIWKNRTGDYCYGDWVQFTESPYGISGEQCSTAESLSSNNLLFIC
jgi:hypothetical protein